MIKRDSYKKWLGDIAAGSGIAASGIIEWILSHISITTSDHPEGPVIFDLNAKKYINIRISLFLTFTFSIELT